MTSNYSLLSNLYQLLTERRALDSTLNDTRMRRRGDLEYYMKKLMNDRDSSEAKEIAQRIRSNQEAQNLTNSISQAGYTWKGISPNLKTKFLYSPENNMVDQGNVNSYSDPLWFKLTPVPRSKKFNITRFVDDNGMILPGHEDIVDRVNKKYGLNIDPSQSITKIKKGDHNYEEFRKWAMNYFIPWYKENGKQGISNTRKIDQAFSGELPKEDDKPIKTVKPMNTPVPQEDYDKSVIEPIVTLFKSKPWVASGELNVIASGRGDETNYSSQQIYNTMLELLHKAKDSDTRFRMQDMITDYRKTHPDVKGKFESVEEDNQTSWLTHNGDYNIFDKLNNIFRLKKESRENNMIDNRFNLQEANEFTSINTNENEFDPSKVTSDIFNDEKESSLSEEDEIKKNRLTKDVINKINKSISLNKEVQDILDEIREINNGNDYNNWVVNEEGNTATLASKNAKIFKQNLNLCLSHNNKIEVFKSVSELHQWLKDHNYPMPKDIQLHESVNLKEKEIEPFTYSSDDPRHIYNGLGKWMEILNLDVIGKDKAEADEIIKSRDDKTNKQDSDLDEDFCIGNMGDTTSASLGTALQYLAKNKKKESLEKGAFINKLKQLKEDDTDVAGSFDSAIQSNAGFGADSSTTTDATSSDLNSGMNSNQDDTVDLGQDGQDDNSNSGFDDININTSGYGPDEGNPEEDDTFSAIPEDEYQIIDVLADSSDNIRVKVKNLTSGEYEYKDLSEIDI